MCTTWGVKSGKAYLRDVFRRKLLFPALKKAVQAQAELHDATVVLIEDMSSGSSLIQQLRADGFSKVRAAPSLEGNKIMRLNGQTPMIEGGVRSISKNSRLARDLPKRAAVISKLEL